MDEPRLKTTAEDRAELQTFISDDGCPFSLASDMVDDIETLLAERDALRNDVADLEMDRDIARSLRSALIKNRDQWERNSAAENKRAGDLEVEVKNLKIERDALAEKLGALQALLTASGLIAHDAEIRRKTLEEAADYCDNWNFSVFMPDGQAHYENGMHYLADAIRALIDAPKEGK